MRPRRPLLSHASSNALKQFEWNSVAVYDGWHNVDDGISITKCFTLLTLHVEFDFHLQALNAMFVISTYIRDVGCNIETFHFTSWRISLNSDKEIGILLSYYAYFRTIMLPVVSSWNSYNILTVCMRNPCIKKNNHLTFKILNFHKKNRFYIKD